MAKKPTTKSSARNPRSRPGAKQANRKGKAGKIILPRTIADVNRDQAHEMEAAVGPIAEAERCSDPTPMTTSLIPVQSAQRSPAAAETQSSTMTAIASNGTPSGGPETPNNPVTSPLASLLQQSIDLQLAKNADNAPHLIVEARAGTGKTTTLVEALRRLKGSPTPGFVPSPQQQAVFDCVELSRGKANSVCFVAFNKSIADELKARVPHGVEAMTMHSMGLRAVTKAFPELRSFNLNDGRNVVPGIIARLLGKGVWDVRRDPKLNAVLKATDQLVSLCKMNLTDLWGVDYGVERWQRSRLSELASQYEIELNGQTDQVFALVPQVLEECKLHRTGFNFDDMIWLPVVLDLPMTRYDLLMVDEAQDLNRCQQSLAKKAGNRLVLCGDPKQAIYGFAGADAESMPRMASELSAQTLPYDLDHTKFQGRGCIVLPLTVTRRCGKAIVREANKYVKDFEAFETNPEGSVGRARMHSSLGDEKPYHGLVSEGDLVLCRVNSILISQCLQFIKAGRRAYIQGKDVGKGLQALVEKQEATTVSELIQKIDVWCSNEVAKEQAKVSPSDAAVEGFRDKRACILALTEGLAPTDSVSMVLRKLDSLFSDQRQENSIKLSSIHKAKGTEARRVFLLALPSKKKDMPPRYVMEWIKDPQQELNLAYVAITRAIEEFIYVS